LNRDGVGLIDVQFFPPSKENLFGGSNSLASKLNWEESKGSVNNDVKDLAICKKFLESNRFKGLLPMIVLMDPEIYYRITFMTIVVCLKIRTIIVSLLKKFEFLINNLC
jgi:hypothetical protein